MKTILVPVDYSDSSDNALKYATQLAKFTQANLILLHVYKVPVPMLEAPVIMVPPPDLEESALQSLKELERKIDGNIQVQSLLRSGFVVDEIMSVVEEKKIDLVVMGITGAGKMSETLIGSHTTTLIKKNQTPVLVVPKEAQYKEIKKIVLAYDYKEALNVAALERFKEFAKLFQAQVLVLDVEKEVVAPMYENTAAGESLENSLQGIDHKMFFSAAEDLTDEINSFVDLHKCDWIAMIPHKHNFFSKLFNESNTKKMAFHTHIPLLSIHN